MSSDGWIQVTTKKGKHIPKSRPITTISTSPSDSDATVESLSQQLKGVQKRWLKSEVHQHVIRVLNNLDVKDEPSVRKAVCLGIGVFGTTNLDIRNRSMIQLSVFLTIVQHLKANHGLDIDLLAQEPRFTELDIEFMEALGFKILDCKVSEGDQTWKTTGIGPAKQYLGSDTFVADFFIDHTPLTIAQLFDSRSRLILSAAHRLQEQTSIPAQRKETQSLMRKLPDHYKWYDLVLPEHDAAFELALHGLQAFASIQDTEHECQS